MWKMFALMCFIGVVSAKYQPTATLYAGTGCTGAFVNIQNNYAPDLRSLGFDNRSYSVSLRGPWLFYVGVSYNNDFHDGMEYIFESDVRCVNFTERIGGRLSSLKYAGLNSDYRKSTITFYRHRYFQGPQELVTDALPSLELLDGIRSLIVTGSSAWTIYDGTSYYGNAICLQFEPSPVYEPVLVRDLLPLEPEVPLVRIASVRPGCHTKHITIIRRQPVDIYSLHGKPVVNNISFKA